MRAAVPAVAEPGGLEDLARFGVPFRDTALVTRKSCFWRRTGVSGFGGGSAGTYPFHLRVILTRDSPGSTGLIN